jgi:hypothetical protein
MYTHEVVRLDITTWVGTCAIGAQHWYGKLKWHDEGNLDDWHEHELQYVMNAKQARDMNRGDEWATYKAGEESGRFWSREDVVKKALEQWQKLVPHGKVLLECDTASCGPCEILAGPPKLVRLGNQLWRADDKAGWDWNKKREIVDKQWQKLFNKHGFLAHFMD